MPLQAKSWVSNLYIYSIWLCYSLPDEYMMVIPYVVNNGIIGILRCENKCYLCYYINVHILALFRRLKVIG